MPPPPPTPLPLSMQAQARAVEREAALKDQLSSFKEEATKQITELTAQLKQKVQMSEGMEPFVAH